MKKTTNFELSILVVDDDENIRMVLQQVLGKEGYHVSTAKSAEEALATLQRSFFHVVITDIMMADRKSTRLNSSHALISYAVFCLKKKKKKKKQT